MNYLLNVRFRSIGPQTPTQASPLPPEEIRRQGVWLDFFEADTAGFRPKNTDREHHHQHAGHDKANHPRRTGVLQNDADQNAGDGRREAAERIAEADRPGANVGREHLGLIGVIADGQPGVGPGDHKAADNQHHRTILQGEKGAEHHRHQGGEHDLPFVLEAVNKAGAEQAANRIGEGNEKGVQQAVGYACALA